MTVSVDVRRRLGDFNLDARFRSDGRLTVLFGRSGSGKTSLIDLVGGLARPDEGRIAVGDRVLVDTRAKIYVPKHRRGVGYVFQDARLFPHLSVRHNLAYGRWFAPRTDESDRPIGEIVELLGISHLLDRRPAGLSGGERQRVAIGRALLARPRLILMDEPLAALDETRKAEIMPYVERLRDEAGVPILYVTHSVPEVLRLASTLVVMERGKVVAQGAADAVLRRLDLSPAGAEVETGRALDTLVADHDDRYGLTTLRHAGGSLSVPRLEAEAGEPVRIRVRARDVLLATRPPEALSALNALPASIVRVEPDGPAGLEVTLLVADQELLARVTRKSFDTMGLAVGIEVHAIVKAVSFDRRYGTGSLSFGSGREADL